MGGVRGSVGGVGVGQGGGIRFGCAAAVPGLRRAPEYDSPGPHGHALIAVAGPDSVIVRGPRLEPDGLVHRSQFQVAAGETVNITLVGPGPPGRAVLERIDEDHANPRPLWIEMGKPTYPSARQLEELHAASSLSPESLDGGARSRVTSFAARTPPQPVAPVTLPAGAGGRNEPPSRGKARPRAGPR